ncbi:hypothetical protein Sjap_009277 [Stephania japonica]|uniref:Uncharacterized protein n=1 Tax=Stephania japonica TaxID=461633 RepID=A0AAP0PBL1_9MAGN
MPRVQDQLSKLTGTALICICMGFCMPSLGTYRESERFSNMVALSIFVVTIVVNICIQMHTENEFFKLGEQKKHVLAEALWARDNFNTLFYEIVEKFGNINDAFRNQSPLEQAIGIIKELKEVMRPDYIRDELAMMTDFIQGCVGIGEETMGDEDMQKFMDLIVMDKNGFDKWTLRRGVKDMKRWIAGNKPNTLNHLKELLSKTRPSVSQESLADLLRNFYDSERPGYEVSPLSIVLVARVTAISIPSALSGSLLLNSLSEVFEIIQFVQRKMNPSTFEGKKKSKLAVALLKSEKFNSHLLPKILKKSKMETSESQSQLIQAIAIIRGLKEELPADYIQNELAIITEFIMRRRVHGSIEDLYRYLEQLYVDMLNEHLVQLPNAIFKEIVECHSEECEKIIKSALRVLHKFEQLEGLVQWSFPEGTTITHLISDEAPSRRRFRSSVGGNTSTTGDMDLGGPSCSATSQDEIIQIE